MMDLKNKENSFINKCFHTDLFPQARSSPHSVLVRGNLHRRFSQPKRHVTGWVGLRALSLAGGTAGRKKNWLTQLNGAAYTAEQPLDEGDYKT